MPKVRYLTAKEVTTLLGVSPATLYAYVSRGLIRSESVEGDSRARRYHAEDVQKLKDRKENRKNPAAVARSALHWGTPILESALTLIHDGVLYYRGYDVAALVSSHTAEQVAALLWTGASDDADRLFGSPPPVQPYLDAVRRAAFDHDLNIAQKLNLAFTLASMEDLAAFQLTPDQVAHTGARILHLMTAIIADGNPESTMAHALQMAWCPANPHAVSLLNAGLILCADHELNVSSFTARVVASAGAQPYMVVSAALGALQGQRHGGVTEQAMRLLYDVDEPSRARRVIADRLRRGERIPGFGHTLYQDGDPRAKVCFTLLRDGFPDAESLKLADSIIEAVYEAVQVHPNIDFALAIMAHVLNLPEGAAFAIFALGRTLGWIGHAIEQYRSGDLIRPRAAYVGVPPR